MANNFDRVIRCTLKELYDCDGVDGFNDLIEAKLGHATADASWKLQGVKGEHVLIHVTGDVFADDEEED